jgi:GDP-D-mannose dehydratase
MAKLLHENGYDVYGLIRGQRNPHKPAIEREFPYVELIEGDLTDATSLVRAVEVSNPDEVYNLGAVSHVGYSFHNPSLTADVTGKGVLNLLVLQSHPTNVTVVLGGAASGLGVAAGVALSRISPRCLRGSP